MKPVSNASIVVPEEPSSTVYNREIVNELYQPPARRGVYQETNEQRTIVFDHDDDKYKRRPPSERMTRWWK